MELTFRFKFDGVSLPYNIYAVLVVSSDKVLAWYDLTKECRGPEASIFPGQSYSIPRLKDLDSSISDLHIIVWGRL